MYLYTKENIFNSKKLFLKLKRFVYDWIVITYSLLLRTNVTLNLKKTLYIWEKTTLHLRVFFVFELQMNFPKIKGTY